jgi:Zn-dependent protease
MTASPRRPVGGRRGPRQTALDGSVRLGRVAGVRVQVHWSVLVTLGLVSWGLGAFGFPRQAPGLEPAAYWVAATGTAVLLLGALLAHELGHALLARRQGIGVEAITLWLFGGMTTLTSQAGNPGVALRIAIVGPLGSMAVALAAGLLAVGAAAIGLPRLVAAAFTWLADVNVALAACNLLIPAAPMDGGRVLQAVLWGRTGDGPRAAVTAARAGRLFGCLLIGGGLVELVLHADLGGGWLACLGCFQLGAAGGEERAARNRAALASIRVRGVMTPDPVVAPGWLTVAAFLEDYAFRYRATAFPVRSMDGALEGLVTLARLDALPASQRDTTTVAAVACPQAEVPTADPKELLVDVLPRLSAGCAEGRALVIDQGRLVGILSSTAIVGTLELAARRAGTPTSEHQPGTVGLRLPSPGDADAKPHRHQAAARPAAQGRPRQPGVGEL